MVENRWTKLNAPVSKRLCWKEEEDNLIVDLHMKYSGNWKKIAEALPGRPPETIKNRYYSKLKKRLPPELRSSRSRPVLMNPTLPEIPELNGYHMSTRK
jgi:hypothetical protein